jgi:hypothetical protein
MAEQNSLHERIAKALGWTVTEAQSFDLHTLRELMRHVSPKLTHELDVQIRSGAYIVGAPWRPRRTR